MALTNKPQDIGPHDWYYEDRYGLDVIHQVMSSDGKNVVRTDSIKIPWRSIRASLNRKDHRKTLSTDAPKD